MARSSSSFKFAEKSITAIESGLDSKSGDGTVAALISGFICKKAFESRTAFVSRTASVSASVAVNAAILCLVLLFSSVFTGCRTGAQKGSTEGLLTLPGISRGICAIIGDKDSKRSLEMASHSEFLIYVQVNSEEEEDAARRIHHNAGLYGSRVFIEAGSPSHIHLADNIVDTLIAEADVPESEVLRVLCPGGGAMLMGKNITKPRPEGEDDWTHPYYAPDNNPQSKDQIARAPYLTQFLADPRYAPLTQVAVSADGRVFKAFGNIAFHVREEPYLNTLVAFNGYNGTILWKRSLTPGVMIHRNTMVATAEILYVGDDKSCKKIDTKTGLLLDEITPPHEQAGGTFWKWMALEDGVLYAVIGEQEQRDPVIRQRREDHGWPWDPLSRGFNQPTNPWGFGRNVLAIDPNSKRVLWSYQEDGEIDGRAICMRNGRIFLYRHGVFLTCLNARSGEVLWRKTPANSPELFAALGSYLERQDWRTNWRTTVYLKCSDKALYFAGPTVDRLLVVSTEDGGVMWENEYNNFQLVLREDGLYGISGEVDEHKSYKFDPLTGEILAELETHRRGCTRPTGSPDAIFYRALGGSTRLDVPTGQAQWVSPMRAQCHDGVTVANGHLYWWPSVCDCQNSIIGVTCLGPAGDFDFDQQATQEERLEQWDLQVTDLTVSASDWPTFRADNTGSATSNAVVSTAQKRLWWYIPESDFTPTAPVTAAGLVFFGGSDGIVRAVDSGSGDIRWQAFTGGSISFPPTVWEGHVLVGSGDGWIYAFEAATGRKVWRFRAAPAERKIPVYGVLLSTWPVSSGVVVQGGIAYCAAGIANYDGTHVYALNAATGEIVWQNNSSGHLNPQSRTGVSVMGHLLVHGGKLYLAGGTSVSPAVYDLKDGRCLNDPAPLQYVGSTSSRGWELFKIGDEVVACGKPMYSHPEYPVYDPTVTNKLLHTTAGNLDIVWINNRRIECYRKLENTELNRCVAEPAKEPFFMSQGWGRFNTRQSPLWRVEYDGGIALARCRNAVVLTGNVANGTPAITTIDIQTGQPMWNWSPQLPAEAVPWGMAVDRDGRIIVTMKGGQVVCYGAGEV